MGRYEGMRLIAVEQINDGVRAHVDADEAARYMGISMSTFYQRARRLGVRRIAGRTVHGGILITGGGGVDRVVCYSR